MFCCVFSENVVCFVLFLLLLLCKVISNRLNIIDVVIFRSESNVYCNIKVDIVGPVV